MMRSMLTTPTKYYMSPLVCIDFRHSHPLMSTTSTDSPVPPHTTISTTGHLPDPDGTSDQAAAGPPSPDDGQPSLTDRLRIASQAPASELRSWARFTLYVQNRLFTRVHTLLSKVNLSSDDEARVDTARDILAGVALNTSEPRVPRAERFNEAVCRLSTISRAGDDADGGEARAEAHETLSAIRYLTTGEGEISET